MASVEELKKEADEAHKKITEIVKDCKEHEGGNLGVAIGSSVVTELGLAMADAAKTPKTALAQIGNGIQHAWRWVTHAGTVKEVSDALRPSCDKQLKNAIQDFEHATERWKKEEASMKKMQKEFEELQESRKKLR
ncbi:MAG: hypothetical protein WCF67_25345, partial [Chitinophagaceae bacterium]